jgi:hypothetical protein
MSRLLRNVKVHYHFHTRPLFDPIQSQLNPVHNLQPYFLKKFKTIIPHAASSLFMFSE